MPDTNLQITESRIRDHLERYIKAYRRILEEKYPKRKKDFWFYSRFPIEVNAYFDDNGYFFKYFFDKPEFRVKVKKVKKIKTLEEEAVGYDYTIGSLKSLREYLDKPEEKASWDIYQTILAEDSRKKLEEESVRELGEALAVQDEEAYIGWIESLEETVEKHYTRISESTQKVQAQTKREKCRELETVYFLFDNFISSICLYRHSNFLAIHEISLTVESDLETSMFLVYSGKYVAAMSLLRRVFETMLKSLYYDSLFVNEPEDGGREEIKKNVEDWMKTGNVLGVSSSDGIIDRLVDDETNTVLVDVLKNSADDFNFTCYKEYLKSIYRYLCQYVHFRGKSILTVDDMFLDFSEYNSQKFNDWYLYYTKIFNAINLLMLVKFPELFEIYERIQKEGKERRFDLPHIPSKQAELLKKKGIYLR